MDSEARVKSARDQLALVLSFFPRADSKLSVVLGIDLAMLGVLATRLPEISSASNWLLGASAATTLLVGLSLWHLYEGSFPSLDGGNGSLVYFRAIAERTEAKFIAEYSAQSADALAADVLGQVWRNSEILRQKFASLVAAYRCMAAAVIFWVAALVLIHQNGA